MGLHSGDLHGGNFWKWTYLFTFNSSLSSELTFWEMSPVFRQHCAQRFPRLFRQVDGLGAPCLRKGGDRYGVHAARAHCSTLQHTAIYCNTSMEYAQHTATPCNTLQHIAILCNTDSAHAVFRKVVTGMEYAQHTATRCNTLQYIGTRVWSTCNTLQHTVIHRNTLQHRLVAPDGVCIYKLYLYMSLHKYICASMWYGVCVYK